MSHKANKHFNYLTSVQHNYCAQELKYWPISECQKTVLSYIVRAVTRIATKERNWSYFTFSSLRSKEFSFIFLNYLMHFEVFSLLHFCCKFLFLVSEIFNVFCETFSSKNKV